MRTIAPLLLTLTLGCKDAPEDADDVDLLARVVGAWTPTARGIFDIAPDPALRWVSFTDDGSGVFTWVEEATGLLLCLDLRWTVAEHALLIDFEPGELSTWLFDGIYAVASSPDGLVLSDASGLDLVLERATAVPLEAQCQRAEVPTGGEPTPPAEDGTGLVALDGVLYYGSAEEDLLIPVVVTEEPVMVPIIDTQVLGLRRVQAFDGEDLWFVDGWSSTGVRCRTLADADCGVLDTVALAHPLAVQAATWDGAHLWLAGTRPDGEGELIRVDPDGPVLTDVVPFDHDVAAMAWDGVALWLLLNDLLGPVVRFDPATGRSLGTWEPAGVHPAAARPVALAVAEGRLWWMIDDAFADGVFVRDVGPVPE